MEVQNNNNNDKIEQVVYAPEDVQRILGIGRRQTYELLKEKRFPVKRVGRRLLIPVTPFNNWLMN